MKLRDYIFQYEINEREEFCKKFCRTLNISNHTLRSWMYKLRKPAPKHVLKIEKMTNRQVTRHELRPDIYPLDEAKK